MANCPDCGGENSVRSEPCGRCRASLPLWLVGILTAGVASLAFWLGVESGRAGATTARPAAAGESIARTAAGAATADPAVVAGIDPLASAAGLTWAIYTSRDRLTDRPLFGARFGTVSGTPLFSVLCAEGEAALALKRGLLPATEGASQDGKATLDTIRVGVRIGTRERERVALRFEEATPESLDAIAPKPLEFLRRVAASRRIRTATDDFDPTPWGEAIARITQECRFAESPGPAPKKRARAKHH